MSLIEKIKELETPIIAAPMFLVSYPELVVATSKNGGIGTMPSLNARTSEDFENMVIEIKNNLNKVPSHKQLYGINLIVHHSNTRLKEDIKICIKHQVPLIITSLGLSEDVINNIHHYGGYVLHDVTNIHHAQKAIAAGVDGIIAVTHGAGGHAGTLNPFAFMQELRSFYNGVICLAGCINTGYHVKAAQLLGANLAYIGTRFIATKEANASEEYKNMLIQSYAKDIIYTNKISGVWGNFLKQSIENAGIKLEEINISDKTLNIGGNKAWKDVWSAGQGVSGINDIPSVEMLMIAFKNEE
jgi:nitronate monooxygenase